jgi:hypothetical protein
VAPTFATNNVAVELGREKSEYNSLIVVRSAIHRPIMLWSHTFRENSECKNNPSTTPPTSLETMSNSLVGGGTARLGWVRKRVCPSRYIPIRTAEASNIVQSARTEPLPSFREQFWAPRAFALVISRIGGNWWSGIRDPVLLLGWGLCTCTFLAFPQFLSQGNVIRRSA